MPNPTVGVCASPNTGKTTLFNRLTGANQTVGNWPGVTVTKKTGQFDLGGRKVDLVDLPGAYSLNPTSLEERVARDFLLNSPPDAIINIVDAGNLYRGLGLTIQLAMSGLPMVVGVNMMDEARAQDIEIDFAAFSEHLGVPVIPLVARSGEGIDELKRTLLSVLEHHTKEHPPHISFPPVLEEAVSALARKIEQQTPTDLDQNFVAMRLMEGGLATSHLVSRHPELKVLVNEAAAVRQQVEHTLENDLPTTCAQCRFNAARGLVQEAVRHPSYLPVSLTEKLDRFLMNRWVGLPLFLLIMFLMFQGVFTLGAPLQDWLATGIESSELWLRQTTLLQALPPVMQSFLLDGLLAGVGVVLSFLPIIVLFFLFLSLIEDSGYMARAAFLMDRLMHLLRLDGKAFISLLLGYGCNVPAVMGTRILSSRHNRILAMLLIPFTLCSARLQVFLFLSAILFAPRLAGLVVFGLYLLSFVIIILVGLLLRPFRFGDPEPFIMELPPYRLPLFRTVLLRAWQEIRGFLKRAATLIVLGVIAIWFLTHVPASVPPGSEATLAGRIGLSLAPVFEPLGIHWAETVALFFGFIAKEIFIGALAVVYGTANLGTAIGNTVTPLQGLSLMVFTLIYTPCVATLASIQAESRSVRVTLLSVALGLALAWLASFLMYQGGLLLGFH
ncbi:MAG: ferrous iron transport protein B [Proteobacteria bacterium]|jgi:ferrous iron transport protein B|nr:ferrous iron transport protein B [Pseudomonadota bacterium]MCG6935529.1 ferrous iron transport protein B [Pseudomonadota bacterium]